MSVGIFIDTSNLYLNVAMCFGKGRKIDYGYLLKEIESQYGDDVVYKAAYGVQVNNKSHSFIGWLTYRGFNTFYHDIYLKKKVPKPPQIKMSMQMAIHILSEIINNPSKYTTIIVGTVDPAFKTLFEQLAFMGVSVVVVGCNIPDKLKESAKFHIEITENYLELTKD